MKKSMPLKDQVCTLEQGKKLKELRVGLGGHFIWQNGIIRTKFQRLVCVSDICPAFTASELMAMLPHQIESHDLIIGKDDRVYSAYYIRDSIELCVDFTLKTLPQSLADLLIWCLEKGYIEAENLTF